MRLPAWARKGEPPVARRARPCACCCARSASTRSARRRAARTSADCFSRGTATFMLLGDRCTRRCGYCSVDDGAPAARRIADEPARVAEAAARLGLRYVVLTAVARDDLRDGGAAHFAATVARGARSACRGAEIEVLTPDFKGDRGALAAVLAAAPDVFNHNIETVPRLFPRVRAAGRLRAQPARCWRAPRRSRPGQVTKSGLMVGLGETDDEILAVLARPARGAASTSSRSASTCGRRAPTRPSTATCRPRGSRRWRAPRARLGLPDRLLRRLRALVLPRGRGVPRPRRAAGLRRPRRAASPGRLAGEALAALSGVLLALSFPKFGHGPWPGSRSRRCSSPCRGAPDGRAPSAWATSPAPSRPLGLLYWTALVVVQFGGLPLAVGHRRDGAALPGPRAVPVALRLAGRGAGSRALRPRGAAAGARSAWVATEILRAHTLFHFPWCLLGYSQHENLPFIQIARLRRRVRRLVRWWRASSRGRSPTWRWRGRRGRAPRRGLGLAVLVLAVGAARLAGAARSRYRRPGRVARGPGAGLDPAGREVGPGAGLGQHRAPRRR